MARSFTGEFVQKLDGKGRVSIPASYRRVLELEDPDWADGLPAQMLLVYGDQRRSFFEGFTMSAMAEVHGRIKKMQRGSKERRVLERTFSGQALTMSIDDSGRIVLPPHLKDKLNLDGEAKFIASVDTFQIWNPKTYQEWIEKSDDWLDDYGEEFDVLSLLESPSED